ncbi:hypothetical protein [Silvimonas iriomotensis]|uniref:Dolichyl-phosphate-mannose-protein mannosyltransferase n=1 Tax=Silvimonas iriomotensis TaxID=449662 RepID=A0ABQ2P7S5_9NEIS|nr:hypothetical protein [Silvimonas iriomotensis]GGP20484.1 hypothetical protein GCM10010970_15440 [Silvimonas iriomotensis]
MNLPDTLLRRHGLFLAVVVVYAAVLITLGPLATNDGPIHLSFADMLGHIGDADWPLQSQMFMSADTLQPNMATYAILQALMLVVEPSRAEAILQALCLVSPAVAAWYTLRKINPDNAWLALFALPLLANQLFFLGLYNFLFSLAGFFLAIGWYLDLRTHPRLWRALLLGVMLVVTLLSHAAGFVMAALALFALEAVRLLSDWQAGLRGRALWATSVCVALALCLPLPLMAWFALRQHGYPTEYGPGLHERVLAMARGKLFRLQSGDNLTLPYALMILMAITLLTTVYKIWQERHHLLQGKATLFTGLGLTLVLFYGFCLIVPDISGGGWTHFLRAELFPMLWALPCAALLINQQWLRRGLAVVAVGMLVMQFSQTWAVQGEVRQQLTALSAMDKQIGAHCTVLPVVESSAQYDDKGRPRPVGYQPFLQATNRLELDQDRVVLFNFLARLSVYPIRFRPGYDTQELLYHWEPQRKLIDVHQLDVDRFEQKTGIPVDYVVVWGEQRANDPVSPPDTRHILSNASLVYESADQQVRLYRRNQDMPTMCTSQASHIASGSKLQSAAIKDRLRRDQLN